jgi:threonine dehydratase
MNQLVTRGLITAGRIVRLIFELRDRPGALKEILEAIASRNVNVLDVQQDRLNKRIGLGPVNVLISMETKGREQTEELLKTLRERGFTYRFSE